jgi:transcriptional regulator with PAS, ATPase and Fis domain
MEFIWLASSAEGLSELCSSLPRVRRADSPQALGRIVSEGATGPLIVEIREHPDTEAAFSVVERWQGQLSIWILDPGATVASSVQWIKAGASHVATCFAEIEELMLSHAVASEPARRRTALIGESRSMRLLEDRIAMVADRRCNVLIEGETGTGKEVAARAIHAAGSRARGPWVAVNCGAIPETLLEAELFGYVKGAFTGAVQSRAGKFEAANRGTIFLDEIGDMPMAVQCKLLRVLQEREVERLGGNESIRLDVRVIAATNSRLAECVRKGSFRQDLFYRLNVFQLVLPPLRERMDDVAALALHFVSKVCASERLPLKTLDPATVDKLMSHSWPGNVRELENTIEAAVISSGTRATLFPADVCWTHDESGFEAVPLDTPRAALPPEGIDFERVLQDFEKNILAQALARTRGNKTAAANLLGLKRTTLAARMRALESRMPSLVA